MNNALIREIPVSIAALERHLDGVLDRPALDPVERAILAIGVYGFLCHPDIPWRVVINEAVGLAKMFGAEQSHKYINGGQGGAFAQNAGNRLRLSKEHRRETGWTSPHASLGIRYHRPLLHAASVGRNDVLVGVGNDGAVLQVPAGSALVVSTDTLVRDVHFSNNYSPEDIGYKALAVNLSDLAAMAAQPAWASLALTLPRADEGWIADFARGFFDLAEAHGVPWSEAT